MGAGVMTVMAMKSRGKLERYENEIRFYSSFGGLILLGDFIPVKKSYQREITRRWSRRRKKGLSTVFIWKKCGIFGILLIFCTFQCLVFFYYIHIRFIIHV